MSTWYDKSCEDCGTSMRVCSDWSNPPRFCKSCKTARAEKWYDKSCEGCKTTMRVCRDWDHPPRFCKSCKAARAAKWYENPARVAGEVSARTATGIRRRNSVINAGPPMLQSTRPVSIAAVVSLYLLARRSNAKRTTGNSPGSVQPAASSSDTSPSRRSEKQPSSGTRFIEHTTAEAS